MRSVVKLIREYLKAVSCALFFNNAWVGGCFLALLAGFSRPAFLSTLICTGAGHIYSVKVSTPRVLKAFGLIVINELFFALAMASLFRASEGYYVFLTMGALSVPVITKASHELLQHWKLSAYNAPYLLVTWLAWLCQKGSVLDSRMESIPLYSVHAYAERSLSFNVAAQLIRSTFYSIGRVLFIGDVRFGILLLALVSVFSPRGGFFLFFGTLVAASTIYLFADPSIAANYGLHAYSAGLVGLALATSPERLRWSTILFFCALSSVMSMGLESLFGTLDLPVLSLPLVLTLWLAALSRTPRVSIQWSALPGLGLPLAKNREKAV